jgi:hypothetical protein
MSTVKNLDSKISTPENSENGLVPESHNIKSYLSGNIGVTAKFSFQLTSPAEAFRAFLRRVLG